ncbi:MAG: Uma2 family endonuclease [Gordonia sp. (in: high G+C Gram-positive bacteria)]
MTEALHLPYGRPLVRADLDAMPDDGRKYELMDGILFVTPSPFAPEQLAEMPDDGHRYELIDGILVVSPAPKQLHQIVVGELFVALRSACPAEARVLIAPFDVALDAETIVQPDLLVARKTDLTEKNLPGAPLLAVEVLSPSTRALDLSLKKRRYADAGCPHYWIVDPDAPSITAWTLLDGTYAQTADAHDDEPFAVTEPFEVTFTPASLTR